MTGIQKARGYTRPNPLVQTITKYDSDPGLIQELDQQNKPPFYVYSFDLSIASQGAGSPYGPGNGYEVQNGLFKLAIPGRAFVLYGSTTGSATKATSNTFYMQVGVQRPDTIWDGKHNRGYAGDFTKLWLGWLAQASTTVNLIVFQYDGVPFMSGDNSLIASAGGGSSVNTAMVLGPQVTLAAATAGIIAPALGTRKSATIQNNSGNTIWVGDSTVTNAGATQGIEVLNKGFITWTNTASLYGYSVAGGVVNRIEEA